MSLSLIQQSSAVTSNQVRLILICDKFYTSVTPSITDILTAGDTVGLPQFQNKSRFQILYDKVVTLSPYGQDGSERMWKINKRINKTIHWPTSITNPKNNIWFVAIGTGTNASSTAVSLAHNPVMRLTYTDV